MHSHNDNFQSQKPLRDAFIPIYKLLMKAVVTDYFTISEKSAKFMFPKSVYESGNYTLVKMVLMLNSMLTIKKLETESGKTWYTG